MFVYMFIYIYIYKHIYIYIYEINEINEKERISPNLYPILLSTLGSPKVDFFCFQLSPKISYFLSCVISF